MGVWVRLPLAMPTTRKVAHGDRQKEPFIQARRGTAAGNSTSSLVADNNNENGPLSDNKNRDSASEHSQQNDQHRCKRQQRCSKNEMLFVIVVLPMFVITGVTFCSLSIQFNFILFYRSDNYGSSM